MKKEAKKANSSVTAIILAAGKGTRMASPLPKVLHPVAGCPMIEKSIKACEQSGVDEIRIVLGHGLNLVKNIVEPMGAKIFIQAQQLGTADAVKAAQVDTISGEVIILNGDHPLVSAEDIQGILQSFREQNLDLGVVTALLKNPKDFGRVVRHKGFLKAIVEAKDASAETLKINEVNTGIYVVKADVLSEFLPLIKNNNTKGEYYLTDLISLASDAQLKVGTMKAHQRVSFGVNSQEELSRATRILYLRKAKELMAAGVMMLDPKATYIESEVEIGAGAVIYPNVFIRGKSKIGPFSVIEPNCYISESTIGSSVQVKAFSHLEKSQLKDKCSIGPFARLRPDTEIGEEASIGNFVELKKVKFGKNSKAGHLTYLGDAEIGENVNIGCGTITCNYAVDKKKYKTIIGNDVFVGSDTQFVAPVTIGDKAVIGSGSTITKDVPARGLAVARGKQFIKENYVKDESEKE